MLGTGRVRDHGENRAPEGGWVGDGRARAENRDPFPIGVDQSDVDTVGRGATHEADRIHAVSPKGR